MPSDDRKEWRFTESEFQKVIADWVQKQHATLHPTALNNAALVAKEFVSILKHSETLKLNQAESKANQLDLNDVDEFKQLIGMSWDEIE